MTRLRTSNGKSLRRRTVLSAGSVTLALPASAGARTQWLITAEEIEEANKMTSGPARSAAPSEGPSTGAPAINILMPSEGGRIVAPVDFDVRFVPVPPSQIDPTSVKIIYSGWLDITKRIREFGGQVDVNGIALSKAPLKPDNYSVTIVVGDNTGRTRRRTVRFSVV